MEKYKLKFMGMSLEISSRKEMGKTLCGRKLVLTG